MRSIVRDNLTTFAVGVCLTVLTVFRCDVGSVVFTPPAQDTTFGLRDPFWSPDGGKIFGFARIWGIEGDGLYEVDSSGGIARLIMRDSLTKKSPTLSPDGRKVAYVAAELGRIWCCAHVWVMNIDGTGAQDLTTFGGNWENVRWSPDSRTVIFDGGVEDSGIVNYQILTADIETGQVRQLTRGNYGNRDAWYLAHGQRIAYLSGRVQTDYGGKVWVMNVDGSNSVPIDTTRTASAYPRPSPVSSELIFSWGLGGEANAGVYSVNLDTVTLPASSLSFRNIWLGSSLSIMQWSPDGNLVVYPAATSSLNQDLYVMNRYGMNVRRLTEDFIVSLFSYAWSPNSQHLVFTASDDQNQTIDLFRYDLNTNMLRKLAVSRE
jgi:Tol biopolymer transport system component